MSRGGPDVKALFTAALGLPDGPERDAYLAAACGGDADLRRRIEDLLAAFGRASDVLGPPGAAASEPSAAAPTEGDAAAGAFEPPRPAGPQATETRGHTAEPGTTLAQAPTQVPRDPEATASRDDRRDGRLSGVALAPGTVVRYFGDYEIRRELGRGGMGVVYQARQVSLNRPVALKMIRSAALASEDEIRRFQNEAEAVARLDHPHIVPVYEVGEHEGQRYFSMKLIGSSPLHEVLASYTANPKAARLMVTIAEAVHHAHQRGILHRDLKPSNILLDERGQPHVTDFGLAKRVEGDEGMTPSLAVLGTPGYMAPEQAWGKKRLVTTLSDVYGLGAVLYALLTGKAPFSGETALETLDRVRREPPVAPSRVNPKVSRDLEVICLKCLEKDPARRYASAQALADDLSRYLAGEPILARSVRMWERAVLRVRRRPAVAGLLGLVALVSALGLGGVLWQWRAAVHARNLAQAREQDALNAQAKERVQSELAKTQAELAEQRLEETLQAQAEAKVQAELAERRLYDARMGVVQKCWEDYHGELFLQGLNEQLPANQGGTDRRGFEWFYWRRKIASGHITLKGHTGSVTSVAFSPDGRWLASASGDQTVKLWDAATGQETFTLEGHTSGVVAFSPVGERLASAGYKGMVKLWDAATGRKILTLKGHPLGVSSLTFSPDGKRLASAGYDGTSLALSPDDRRLARAAAAYERLRGPMGATAKLWDVATGREKTLPLKSYAKTVSEVAFSPDGRWLAAAADRMVKVWDAETVAEDRTLEGHAGAVVSVAFSPDGRRLVSADHDGIVKIWDAATGRETLTLRENRSPLYHVTFSPDGRWLAAASDDQTVKVWDAETGRETRSLKAHTGAVTSIAFSPDSKRIASASRDQTVKIWDTVTGQEPLAFTGHTGDVGRVAFSPDGRRIGSASRDQTVKVWDTETGRETLTFKGHTERIDSVAFSPEGKRLASAGGDRTVRVWDTETGRETRSLKGHTGDIVSVAFSLDGRRLASASVEGAVRVWDAETGREILILGSSRVERTGPVSFESLYEQSVSARFFGVAFSPDGKQLASAGGDSTVRVWDAETGREILTLYGHTGAVYSVAFDPDGRRLASGGHDGMVRIWDARTGHAIGTLKGHTQGVNEVAFSADGQRLASASWDRTVRLWDAATGQETLILTGGGTGVAFSADGRRLASGGGHTVKVWDARPLDDEPAKPGSTPR